MISGSSREIPVSATGSRGWQGRIVPRSHVEGEDAPRDAAGAGLLPMTGEPWGSAVTFITRGRPGTPMETRTLRTGLLLAICIAIPLIIGSIGTLFTYGSLTGWYALLEKPVFTPPAWVFAPVWTCLYILMGISLFLVLREGTGSPHEKQGIVLFAAQLVTNLVWIIAFFGLRSLGFALGMLLLLIALIAATVLVFRRISVPAAWLLVPYLAWCCIAATLNAGLLLLN